MVYTGELIRGKWEIGDGKRQEQSRWSREHVGGTHCDKELKQSPVLKVKNDPLVVKRGSIHAAPDSEGMKHSPCGDVVRKQDLRSMISTQVWLRL